MPPAAAQGTTALLHVGTILEGVLAHLSDPRDLAALACTDRYLRGTVWQVVRRVDLAALPLPEAQVQGLAALASRRPVPLGPVFPLAVAVGLSAAPRRPIAKTPARDLRAGLHRLSRYLTDLTLVGDAFCTDDLCAGLPLRALTLADTTSREIGALPPTLGTLVVDSAPLRALPGLKHLAALRRLKLESCPHLGALPPLPPGLVALSLGHLTALRGVLSLGPLQECRVRYCSRLTEIRMDRPAVAGLRVVSIQSCRRLQRVPDFATAPALQHLHLVGNALRAFPRVWPMRSLILTNAALNLYGHQV